MRTCEAAHGIRMNAIRAAAPKGQRRTSVFRIYLATQRQLLGRSAFTSRCHHSRLVHPCNGYKVIQFSTMGKSVLGQVGHDLEGLGHVAEIGPRPGLGG